MTSPHPGPRPVGPPPPPGKEGFPPGREGFPPRGPWNAPATRVYSWSSSGRPFPWFAILLLVLGIGLLIELLIPDLSFASLIILGAGIAFGVAWLFGRIVGATMPALVLLAWGLAGIGADLGILVGDGWTTLAIGLAFLAGWALAGVQGTRRGWALFLGSILAIIGLADVSDALPFDLGLAVVIPLAMIGIGIYLVMRARLPMAR